MIHRAHPGYTLLEVVLSLALVSLVLLCVAAAVDLQMRIADSGRGHVEEAQLARTLLHRMADDLRSALPYRVKTQASMSTSSGSSATNTTSSTSSASAASSTTDSSDTSDSSSSESTHDVLTIGDTPMVVSSTLGVYGGEDWLQVDISRLSRVRRATLSTTPGEDDPAAISGGDLKLVSYFVAAGSTEANATSTAETGGGLVRRELDRTVLTVTGGQPKAELARTAETLLAPEVQAVRFSYSDGYDWYNSWDTSDTSALPQAVEIVLTVQCKDGTLDYRLIVDLPAARAGTLTEPAVMSSGNSMTSTSTSTSTTPSGSSTGGSQ